MSENITFSEDAGIGDSPGQRVARIGVCSAGVPGTVYEFAGGQQGSVPDRLGYGLLAATTARGALYGKTTTFAVPAAVAFAGTISDVTKTGDGPDVTAEAVPESDTAIEGPWFAFKKLLVRITDPGELGVARGEYSYDGVTIHDTFELPPELPASRIGTVDITALTEEELDGLNTLTYIADPDTEGPCTTTFSGVDGYQDILDQIDESFKTAATVLGTEDLTAYTPGDINTKTFLATLTVGETVTPISVTFSAVASLANIATQIAAATGITAALETGDFISVTTDDKGEDVQLVIGDGTANSDLGFTEGQTVTGDQFAFATLVGGKYVKITAKVLGSSGTLDIGSGTANEALGFTDNDQAEGVDSAFDIPGAGVRLLFEAGDYEANTTYELSTTAPRMSLAGMQAAAAVLRDDGASFGVLLVVYEPTDGLEVAEWQAALKEITDEWAAAEENPIFVKWVLPSALGEEGEENWQANDQDVKTALTGTQSGVKVHTIAHGDIWVEWVEYSGRHRSSLAYPDVERMARYAINIDPGLGSNEGLEQCFLKSIEGVPARTEARAIVKMQDHGFTVLKNEKQAPQIRAGRTRAPDNSQLTGESTARAALECARVVREVAEQYSNDTPALAPNGQLREVDKGVIQKDFQDSLDDFLVDPGYVSSGRFVVTGITTVGGKDKLLGKAIMQRLANIRDADITVFVTNKVEIVEGA